MHKSITNVLNKRYQPTEVKMTSYAAEVKTPGDTNFVGNGFRFATEDEAQAYVLALSLRWTSVQDSRVVETRDPVSYVWRDGKAEATT